MARLVVHRAFGSPPARSVMMLADILGLQVDYRDVNLLLGEHKRPEFKKLNPMCTVPVLEDDGFVLSERYVLSKYFVWQQGKQTTHLMKWLSSPIDICHNSASDSLTLQIRCQLWENISHAILKYLITKYGNKDQQEQWYPSELRTRSIVDQSMFFNAGVFFVAFRDIAFSTLFGGLTSPAQKDISRIESSYEIVDTYLRNREYMAADHMTLADLSVGATATAGQIMHKVNANRHPRCAEWLAKVQEESVFQRVNSPGVVFMEKLLNKMWKQNRSRDYK